MRVVSERLEPAVKAIDRHGAFTAPSQAALRAAYAAAHAAAPRAAGLNTVGLLLDRLTILAMKHWATRHRAEASHKAADLERTQVAEIVRALEEATPGLSSVNNKMTAHAVDAEAPDFSAAIFGLFTTNLLLWEAQEVLYHHDLAKTAPTELRAYVSFFSSGNLRRNGYIQACDVHWWALAEAAARNAAA